MTIRKDTALFEEHLAHGADMESYSWAGMKMPWTYASSLADEMRAVRERAGLADVTQLKVVRVAGPDAAACVEELVPRPIADMAVGRTRFSLVLSRFGRISDEALIMRVAQDEFWLSYGGGNALTQLNKLAKDRDVEVEALDDMHVLSLQGPRARDVLLRLADEPVDDIPYLHNRRVSFDDKSVLLSRSGFTGEGGFEIFCAREDVVALWRDLLGAGKSVGLIPYSYQTVDALRVEAGFPVHPSDLAFCASIWEAGMGWLLRGKEADYVGKESVAKTKGKAEFKFIGARIPGDVAIAPHTKVELNGAEIGMVTGSAYCPSANATLSILRVRKDTAVDGSTIELKTEAGLNAEMVQLPFRARRNDFYRPDSMIQELTDGSQAATVDVVQEAPLPLGVVSRFVAVG